MNSYNITCKEIKEEMVPNYNVNTEYQPDFGTKLLTL